MNKITFSLKTADDGHQSFKKFIKSYLSNKIKASLITALLLKCCYYLFIVIIIKLLSKNCILS